MAALNPSDNPETVTKAAPPPRMAKPQPNMAGPRPLPSAPPAFRAKPRKSAKSAWLTFAAFVCTIAWFGVVGFYVVKAGGFTGFLESSGATAIVAVTGLMLAPAAIMWMMFAYAKRAYDVEFATEPLLKQLALITGQGGVAENRIRRFNEALAEQLSLLKQTSEVTNRAAEEALATLRLERDEMGQAQSSFTTDINILLNTMRGQTSQLETLVQSGQSQLSLIAQKAQDINNLVGTQTDSTEARLTDLLAAISGTLGDVGRMADDRINHLEEVTDRLADRERGLRDEANITANELQAAAGAINEAMAGFKVLASEGRSEADRLLSTLQSHALSMDGTTQNMLARMANAKDMVEQMAVMLGQTADKMVGSGSMISDDITERVRALADAATALDVTTSKITRTLEDSTHQFTDDQGRITAMYESVIAKLQQESAALKDEAMQLTLHAGAASQQIGASVNDLFRNTESHIAEMSSQIEDRSRALAHTAADTSQKIGGTVTELMRTAEATQERVQETVGELQRTTIESMNRYEDISAKAAQQAGTVADNFNTAISSYEGAAKRLNSSAADLQALATRCGETLTFLDEKLSVQVDTLNDVSDRVGNTSRNVKDDASALVVTLQQMIDRLETVRAGVGATTDTALIRLNDVSTATSRQFTALETVASGALDRLEQAGSFAGEQTEYIEGQLQKFDRTFTKVREESEGSLGTLMRQLQSSCDAMGGMLDGFASKVTNLQPILQEEANKAAELATGTVEAMVAQTGTFSQRLAMESGRWAGFVEDQSKAFAQAFAELKRQMDLTQEAHAGIAQASGTATDKILTHTGALAEVEKRIAAAGRTQQEQLQGLKGDLEQMLEYMQRQALSLGSITQQAVENVRGACEAFGEQSLELNTVVKVSETVLTDINHKMGVAGASAETLQTGLNTLRDELVKITVALDGYFTNLRDESEKTIFANDSMMQATRDGLVQLKDMTTTLAMAADQAVQARATTVAELDAAAARLNAETNALGQRGRTAVAAFTGAANTMGEKADVVFGQLQRAADQLKATEQTMSQLEKQATAMRAKLVDDSETMVVALDKVANDLTSRLHTLRATGESTLTNAKMESDAIANLLVRATDDVMQSVATLKDVSGTATSTLEMFSGSVNGEIATLGTAQVQLQKLCNDAQLGESQVRLIAEGLTGSATQSHAALQALGAQMATQHEALAGRQADALAKLSATLQMLDTAAQKVSASGTGALEIATAVETRFTTVADFADKTITEKAQSLALSAATAEQAMQNYAVIAGSSAEAFTAQQHSISTLVQTLRADLDATEARLAALADKVTATSVTTGAATHEIINRLSTAVGSMLGEFSNVDAQAEVTTRGIMAQSEALRSETAKLAESARDAGFVASTALEDLQSRAGNTQHILASEVQKTLGMLTEAEERYNVMASTLGNSEVLARSALSTLTHTFTDILETATRSLDQLKNEFETTALAATGTLNQSQDVMSEKSAAFTMIGEKISAVVETLGSKSGTALEGLQALISYMETTTGRATSYADQTTAKLHDLASTIEQRHQQLSLSAEETTTKLGEASQNVLREVGSLVEQTLKADSQARIVAAAVAQGAQDAAQATSQFTRDAEKLASVATQTAQATEKAAQMMQLGSETAIKMLEVSGDKLQATSEKVITTLENETNRFRAATSISEAQLERFGDLVANKALDFLQVSETLASQGQKLEAQITQFAGNTLAAIERLSAAQNAAGGMTDTVAGKLGTATDAIADKIVLLDERAKGAAETLEATGRTVLTQATTLQQQAQLAESQVHAVKSAIEELKHSAGSLKSDIAGETEALSLALAKALAELESAGDTLFRQSQQTQQAVMQMGQTLAVSTRDLGEVTQHYQREQENIRTNAQTVLADTARVLGEFYGFKNHMTNQVDELTKQMADVAGSAEGRMRSLAGHLQSVVAEISTADTMLGKKLSELGTDHTKLRGEVERSVQIMAGASNRLREVSSNAYAEIEDLTSRMAGLRHAAGSEVANQVTHLRNMVESASVLLHDLGRQLEGQTKTVEVAHTDIVKRAGSVSDQTRNALQQLQALTQKLENAKLAAGSVASGAAGKLGEILEQVEKIGGNADNGSAEKVG